MPTIKHNVDFKRNKMDFEEGGGGGGGYSSLFTSIDCVRKTTTKSFHLLLISFEAAHISQLFNQFWSLLFTLKKTPITTRERALPDPWLRSDMRHVQHPGQLC